MLGMAGLEGAHADEGYANTGGPKDGPVLTMMSKRLRALRKKFNRILQIEENKAQGKPVNKEQEDVLKTKIAIAALIDEYEKLRQPLLVAVREEVSEREKELMAASLQRQDEDESVGDETERDHKAAAAAECEQVNDAADGQAEHAADDAAVDVHDNGGADEKDEERVETEIPNATENHVDESTTPIGLTDAQIGDLLKLLYFAQLFDVRSQGEAPSFVWTKVHERSSCLSYDFVTDDATTPLVEGDLDALSVFGSLVTTRSPNVTVSHKEALEKCIEHAKAYMAGSDGPVGELGISYSRLRERLNRILSSEYFTMTPELQTVSQQTAAAAATAAGQYVTKAPALEPQVIGGIIAEEDDSSVGYYHQDVAVSAQYYQPRAEYLPAVPMVLGNGIPLAASPLVALTNTAPYVPETMGASADTPQFGSHDEASQATSVQENSSEQEHAQPVNVQPGLQGQQHHNQHGHPQGGPRGGGYQNMRGRQGGYGGQGGRGGRGGFSSGRGGRTGRGPGGYMNGGRGGHFFEQGGYYPRNHYGGGGRGGRGGRGGGGNTMYNGHANGPAPSGPPPPAVATGSS